jgi:hypothetical protein
MNPVIATIVEGHGDVSAVPHLLRMLHPQVDVPRPVRFPKSQLVHQATLERAVRYALANIPPNHPGLILLVIDADKDCPATLGTQLLRQMQPAASGVDCYVVIAKREFECWILGGVAGFGEDNPEAAGMAKEKIRAMNGGLYKESIDQVKFTSRIDPDRLAERSPSFRRLKRRLEAFIAGG